jgi:pimeloyl-ACP methyl ester carboxylesterase
VGALIALEIAAMHPERVEKLILVGCPARDAWQRLERLTLAAFDYDPQGNPKPLTLAKLAITYAHPSEQLLEWVNQQRTRAGLWVKKTLIAVSLYDIFPKLPIVKCPTLVLFGSQDYLREGENLLLDGIKGAEHALVEDAGHLPQVEKPQAFLKEVNRFLNA